MTMPGMLDMNSTITKPRRSRRSKFIAKMFAVGVAAAMIGGGVAIVQNAPQADAISQKAINTYIRSEGGIAPCTHEDGSGQVGPCYWDASERGNFKGWDYIAVPQGAGKDKALVYLTGPKAVRY